MASVFSEDLQERVRHYLSELALQRRFALLRRFKALETCKNAIICPFFGVSKRRSNIQHVVVI